MPQPKGRSLESHGNSGVRHTAILTSCLWRKDGGNSKEPNSVFHSTHVCWTALASWEVVSEAEFIEREY